MKEKRRVLVSTLSVVITALLFVTVFLIGGQCALAETAEVNESGYSYVSAEVNATFDYTILNETNCNVRITNKSLATRAIIPSAAEINGQTYTVTEIAPN